jgi:hypothetical protein
MIRFLLAVVTALVLFATAHAKAAIDFTMIEWTPASGPVAYYVLEASLDGAPFAELGRVDAPTTSVSVPLDPGVAYVMRVAACTAEDLCVRGQEGVVLRSPGSLHTVSRHAFCAWCSPGEHLHHHQLTRSSSMAAVPATIQRYPLAHSVADGKRLAIYICEAASLAAAGGHIVTGASTVLNVISAEANETAVDGDTAPAQATGTVTFNDAGNATETITINGIVYTQELAPDDVVTAAGTYDIDVGASATATGDALVAAITGVGGTPGTTHGIGIPPHPDVTASNAAGVVTITARVAGTDGNAITLAASDTATSVTLSGATLSGGTDSASGNPVKVRSFPNSQTASTTEDDAGDIFVDHGGAGSENVKVVALVLERDV